MKSIIPIISFTTILVAFTSTTDFLSQQKKFERVRNAIEENQGNIEAHLNSHHLQTDDFHIMLIAYKDEGILDLHAKRKNEQSYKKIKSYKICRKSGELGPKRKEGDLQVPEGFYYIDRFNPNSNFHLSLGLNYPNLADQKKSDPISPGGNIFIHGSCVTVGCLPLTDEKIKELYVYAVYAANNNQKNIPVYIFPFRMTGKKMALYKEKYKCDITLIAFWENLKISFDQYNENKEQLKVDVSTTGEYLFQ